MGHRRRSGARDLAFPVLVDAATADFTPFRPVLLAIYLWWFSELRAMVCRAGGDCGGGGTARGRVPPVEQGCGTRLRGLQCVRLSWRGAYEERRTQPDRGDGSDIRHLCRVAQQRRLTGGGGREDIWKLTHRVRAVLFGG